MAALALLGAGCASPVPQAIRSGPADQPTIAAAQATPLELRGRAVRWGGELVAVRNLEQASELEILGRDLDRDGEPDPDSPAAGRFLARVNGFVDPAEYRAGDHLTVAGVLEGSTERKVGEYDYRLPVVAVREYYRWPERAPAPPYYRYPPHYYDPWPYHYPWWPAYRPFGWPYPWRY